VTLYATGTQNNHGFTDKVMQVPLAKVRLINPRQGADVVEVRLREAYGVSQPTEPKNSCEDK
jgi:hypothetical protein